MLGRSGTARAARAGPDEVPVRSTTFGPAGLIPLHGSPPYQYCGYEVLVLAKQQKTTPAALTDVNCRTHSPQGKAMWPGPPSSCWRVTSGGMRMAFGLRHRHGLGCTHCGGTVLQSAVWPSRLSPGQAPTLTHAHTPDLSISLSRGKETNQDSPSNSE